MKMTARWVNKKENEHRLMVKREDEDVLDVKEKMKMSYKG
jgi:hypothetical protein